MKQDLDSTSRVAEPTAATDTNDLPQLIQQYRAYLLAVADCRLDPELRVKVAPSDLVQETLLDACLAVERFTGRTEADVRRWLRRLLLNNLSDAVRRYRRAEKRRERLVPVLNESAQARMQLASLIDSRPTPHTAAVSAEAAQALVAALERLPPKYQHVLRLRHHEALSFSSIAAALGLSENAARKLWVRAIERLQLEFEVSE